ncbi:MAG TPA: HEAT repeat domain-containing protein [Bryobacteraceae bacterium]|nr:HEAT repeat domain-containing protein [Bryobacteraceae bacterium]
MRTPLLLLVAALSAAAQPKKLVNAQLDTRSAQSGLESVFRTLTTAQPQPAWIAYTVPAARGRYFGCDSYWRDGEFIVAGGTVHLEPPGEVMVLYRADAGQVGRIRTLAPDCDIDAGGVPVHWLTDVRPADSVALLTRLAAGPDRSSDSAINAIGMHAGAAADAALEQFVAFSQPEAVRQKAVQWLGLAGNPRRFEALKKVLASDPSDRVRERAVQSLAQRKEAEAVDLVIVTARNDRSPKVRGQALYTLSRQAGKQSVKTIQEAIESDSDREVKRRAVSALQHLPDGEGIPLLIGLAKTSRNAEVRKQAMSSLAQSRDSRAIAFFEDVLKARP